MVILIAAATGFQSEAAMRPSPSFDCAKATTPNEIAICASRHLAALDRAIAGAYGGGHGDSEGKAAVSQMCNRVG